jgi:hypothetical protein
MDDIDEYSRFPRSLSMKILYGLSALIALISLILPFLFWSVLPDKVPRHFDFYGHPGNWGGKDFVFFAPVVNLIFIIFSFIYSPPADNPRQFHRNLVTWAWFRLWVVSVLTQTEWMTIQIALGNAQDMGKWFMAIAFGILLIIIGYHIFNKIKNHERILTDV